MSGVGAGSKLCETFNITRYACKRHALLHKSDTNMLATYLEESRSPDVCFVKLTL